MRIGNRTVRVLVALAGVFFGLQAASAGLPDGGTITLTLGTTDQIQWVTGSTTLTQAIKDKRDVTGASKDACALALVGPELLTITSPQGKVVGFNNQKDWIGIRDQSRGVDCGRSVTGQTLKIALGSQISANLVVRRTSLKINAKKNAIIRAVVNLNGSTQTFTLKTGLSATGQPNPPFLQFCNAGVSDSSPDSNANCPAWEFDGAWKDITFYTDAGEWSLASGSSTFSLAEFSGLLGCDASNRDIDEIMATNGLTSSGYRLGNVADPQLSEPTPSCVIVPYVFTATCPAGITVPPGSVCTNFVYDPLNQGTHMAFYFQWKWPPEAFPLSGDIDDIRETLQFFLNGNTVGFELNLCPEIRPQFDDAGTPDDPTDDVFTGIDPNPLYAPHDQDTSLGAPGTQAGCLITRDVIHSGTRVLLIEGAYVQGDYVGSRSVN